MTELSYYSIGENCETAFEIMRHTLGEGVNYKSSQFFDWIVSEPNSLKFITKINDKNFLQEWDFVKNDTWPVQQLKDKFSGLAFPHEYRVGLDTAIDEIAVLQQVNNVSRKKFLYLKDKFLDMVSKNKIPILIRLENKMTDSEARCRLEYLVEIFGKINPRVKFILASQSFEKNYT